MVAAISAPVNTKRTPTPRPARPPLLPSESDNAIAPPRRPKAREVTSRYLSSSTPTSTSSCSSSTTSFSSSSVSSTPRRCNSPMVTRTVNSSAAAKRSQSVERRRQGTPRPSTANGGGAEAPAAQRMLFTATRSLSVSFQGESFPIQVSKPAPSPTPASLRKSTPERRKATHTPTPRGSGNSDQHRWPGKLLPAANCMNRSLDCGDSLTRKLGAPASVVRSLQNSMDARVSSHDGAITRSERNRDYGGSESLHELVSSDSESVTSGSSSGAQEFSGAGAQRGSRSLIVPARFWQEASNKNGGNRAVTVPQKLLAPKRTSFDCPGPSPRGAANSRGQASSPIRSAVRPASPMRLSATPSPAVWSPSSRGVSPAKVRNGVAGSLNNRFFGNEPSVLSFAVDVPRGKVGENRIVDAHLLRLVYNRHLQWRFVNARADASLSAQTLNAEKSLYDAWLATSKLRESVRAKRTELQLLKQQLKLMSILKGQMMYLEDWPSLDRMYSSSLSGAIEALKGSTLRLPVVSGAKADVLNVKDAICSAMDVMQAMASSICLLLPKVGHVNSLVVEVANLSAKEMVLLEECKDLLSMLTTMQVRECSLRSHISQLKRLPWRPTTKLTSK
ncbi:protein SNOWY COTYLEDON 3-like [Arachis stenosperma]|uniref:protein SNOWY COTYLEDON 3-like n=1 Tax=Arachis stenosperma TaxID=217475 RepID=UPI0025AD8C0E|nr:protein SNOWY COTYLEDON 3-like [Arachis stenosperma]